MLLRVIRNNFSELIGLSLVILIFSLKLNIYAIILIIISWVLNFDKKYFKENIFTKKIFLFTSFFALTVLACLWSCDFKLGLFVVEKRFSMLLFPILIFTYSGDLKVSKILDFVSFGSVVGFVYCFCFANYQYYLTGDEWTPFRYFNFTVNAIGIHPGYLSMYLILSFININDKIRRTKALNTNVILYLFLFFIFFSILYIGTKSAFFILIFLSLVFIIINNKSKRLILIYSISFLILILIISFPLYYFSYGFRTRVVFLLNGRFNNIGERLEIYKAVIYILKEHKWANIYGLGTGCLKENLLDYYHSHDLISHFEKQLDAHSIFFKSYAEQGSMGLMSIIFQFQGLQKKYLNLDLKYFLFSVSFFLFGMIEHFIDLQHGIVFFTLLNVIFYAKNNRQL